MRPQTGLHPSRRGKDAAPQDEGFHNGANHDPGRWMPLRRGQVQDRGEPANVRICHCRTCQKAMGSPFFARALFDQRALRVEGDTAHYPSSAALERVFCKSCGSRLFSRRTNGTMVGVALAAFDDRNAFAPTEHIWLSEKMDWVRIDDGLKQYRESVPQ